MAGGAETKTSQVSVEEYREHFEGLLKQGLDVLHVTLSTGLTGTYNSACIARDMLAEKYPERKLYVVDSLGASSGYGLIMETLADMLDGGATIDELHGWVMKNRLRMHHWFFSTDLSFYVRGGRISKAAGAIGTVLNICPLLNMDNEGPSGSAGEAAGQASGDQAHRRDDVAARGERNGVQRAMLHLPLAVHGGRADRRGDGGEPLPAAEREGGNLSHRRDHRQPHRPRHHGAVLLGRRAHQLNQDRRRIA